MSAFHILSCGDVCAYGEGGSGGGGGSRGRGGGSRMRGEGVEVLERNIY